MFVIASGATDFVLRPDSTKTIAGARAAERKRSSKGKGRGMESSYEVLGDSNSEGAGSASETEEEINGEEVRSAMEAFRFSQSVRTALSGAGFLMSVVGIWGDGF